MPSERIHTRLNQIAMTSTVTRRVTYVCASTFAYILIVWAVLEIILAVPPPNLARTLQYSFGVAILSRLVVECVYVFYKRPRPSRVDGIDPLFINTNPSFPSGHAAFFSALATALILLETPYAVVFFVATLIMCIARVAAGVHFFTDIIGGFVVGVGTTFILFSVIGLY